MKTHTFSFVTASSTCLFLFSLIPSNTSCLIVYPKLSLLNSDPHRFPLLIISSSKMHTHTFRLRLRLLNFHVIITSRFFPQRYPSLLTHIQSQASSSLSLPIQYHHPTKLFPFVVHVFLECLLYFLGPFFLRFLAFCYSLSLCRCAGTLEELHRWFYSLLS